jgi:hypothetical protein
MSAKAINAAALTKQYNSSFFTPSSLPSVNPAACLGRSALAIVRSRHIGQMQQTFFVRL